MPSLTVEVDSTHCALLTRQPDRNLALNLRYINNAAHANPQIEHTKHRYQSTHKMAPRGLPDKGFMLDLSGRYTISYAPHPFVVCSHCKYTPQSPLTQAKSKTRETTSP